MCYLGEVDDGAGIEEKGKRDRADPTPNRPTAPHTRLAVCAREKGDRLFYRRCSRARDGQQTMIDNLSDCENNLHSTKQTMKNWGVNVIEDRGGGGRERKR